MSLFSKFFKSQNTAESTSAGEMFKCEYDSKHNGIRLVSYTGTQAEVRIPEDVMIIGSGVFDRAVMKSVIIPDSVRIIDYGAFIRSGLTHVTIPAGVTEIAIRAFAYCAELTEINVDKDNSAYTSADGVLFSKDMTALVQFPTGKGGDYSIPDGVTFIFTEAFSGCHMLKSVTIPSSLTEISDCAFSGADSLESVIISEGVTSIGDAAFGCCPFLENVTIPDSVTAIGNSAFYECVSLSKEAEEKISRIIIL